MDGGHVAIAACLLLLLLSPGREAVLSDGCDWSGSGQKREGEVQPIYLRCSQGSVRWKEPRGALRVLLRLGTSGRKFHGCIEAGSGWPRGVRVYLEGHRRLHLLLDDASSSSVPTRRPRCFHSVGGQAALYVEADPARDWGWLKGPATFAYDLQPLNHRDPLRECQPCSTEELLRLYCASDFVVRGNIVSTNDNVPMDRTELRIRVEGVVRDTSPPLFPGEFAYVHMPLSCGARNGPGSFLLIGRRVFGRPLIWCAPRYEEWNSFKSNESLQLMSQCELE